MSILATLKLVELTPAASKATLNRRRKLIEKVDEQILLAEGAGVGGAPSFISRRIKSTTGVRRRPNPWWYEKLDGTAILTVRFNRKPLEFAPGKAAIECKNLDAVASTLKLIRQAVIDGELDELLAPAKRVRRHTGNKKGAAKRV